MAEKRYLEIKSPYYCKNCNEYYRVVDGYWKSVQICDYNGKICNGKTFPSWCPLKVIEE